MADGLYPPHSRLFVACDKDTSEEELTTAFNPYGTVVKVNLCRDRQTGAAKGFAFIQYDKTSEAAAAMEARNGSTIGNSSRPIRVTVALSKDQSNSNAAPDLSQFLRLFLVVPKTSTENDLRDYFSQFGALDTVSIVKDRETKESKGYAYVKYRTFLDAARAYENCDRMYKVVFAKPKDHMSGARPSDHKGGPTGGYSESVSCTHLDENPDGYTCLRAMLSSDLDDEQIEWLFDIPPGMEFVRFFPEAGYQTYDTMYTRKVMVQYDSPGAAAYAFRKLNGFEYPRGERVLVKPDYAYAERSERAPMVERRKPAGNNDTVSDLMYQVETLTKSLNDATRLLQSAGVNPAPLGRSVGQVESFRCSAKLPPAQPLAPAHSPCVERLFLVCEPGLPPQDALWDVFGRFGNLIELYILNGKNCGYAKFADKNSAQRAIQSLNGQELYRMKMKVMVAEPQPRDGERKRPRMN